MNVIDTDILLIAARYPRDDKAEVNARFLEHVQSRRGQFAITIFNKLEAMGELSFGMNEKQFQRFFSQFEQHFCVQILRPRGFRGVTPLLEGAVQVMERKAAFSDALILMTAESHPRVETLVTWDARHFVAKTRLRVVTPEE